MDYRKPKVLKVKKVKLIDNGKNRIFVFDLKDSTKEIKVDESLNRIKSRMLEVIKGKRNRVYLSYGMLNIDIDYLGDNKWQLFDELDVYIFDINVKENDENEKE